MKICTPELQFFKTFLSKLQKTEIDTWKMFYIYNLRDAKLRDILNWWFYWFKMTCFAKCWNSSHYYFIIIIAIAIIIRPPTTIRTDCAWMVWEYLQGPEEHNWYHISLGISVSLTSLHLPISSQLGYWVPMWFMLVRER